MPTKFLYLAKIEHVAAWTDGGAVPLSLASKYLDIERHETRTPDETFTKKTWGEGDDIDDLERRFINPIIGGGVFVSGPSYPRGPQGEATGLTVARWDGLVLCLSNSESKSVCSELGKAACVAIDHPLALFQVLSAQLGVAGEHRHCDYTDTRDRDVFLKSKLDRWQDEYRMFWLGAGPRSVTIPPQTARLLWLLDGAA
jgi:hypothetical protein